MSRMDMIVGMIDKLFKSRKKPDVSVIGMTNRTEDNNFILFADYDQTNLETVEQDADFLQVNYDVGDLLILRSSEEESNAFGNVYANYHLIGFTKFKFPELLEILKLLRCDEHFKKGWRYQNRAWVLRIGTKGKKDMPELVSFIRHSSNRVYSNAHLNWFSRRYGFDLKNGRYMKMKKDNLNNVEIITYSTVSK